MSPLQREFDAILEQPSRYPQAAFVRIPFDVEEVYGKKKVKIKAEIDGILYRGTLTRMETDFHMLLILKEIREQLGKNHGDTVHISLEPDLEERVVEVPGDLEKVLQDAGLWDKFQAMAYTHRKEYAQWIAEAKKQETRTRRLQKAVEMMQEGKKLS